VVQLTINGKARDLDIEPNAPLLWVLRDELGLTGTKFGCGIGACGACTVHIDGVATRSCITPIERVAGKSVTTIEALSPTDTHAVQQAWIAEDVVQCGYCQSGQIMAAVALLRATPNPTDADINAKMSNLCRCGTYPRIRKAIHRAAAALAAAGQKA
jgi:aerobic-type carbon monoxide dehydrogenase small subunit (CoxS/CutS family)